MAESWENASLLVVAFVLPIALILSQVQMNREKNRDRKAQGKWLELGKNKVVLALQNNRSQAELCQSGLTALAEYMDMVAGHIYLPGETGRFRVGGTFGLPVQEAATQSCQMGEGPVGLALADGKPRVIEGGLPGHLTLKTGFGPIHPQTILIFPLVHGEQIRGCLEMAFTRQCTQKDMALLENIAVNFCVALEGAASQEEALELLRVTQNQAQALERSRLELNDKAEALANAGQFKSRFLANMSHELRSPLNSVMLLAQMIAEKPTPVEQAQENARTIQKCGQELLNLINDVLDLSKIEAGKLEFTQEPVDLKSLINVIQSSQGPLAQQKGLDFQIGISPLRVPEIMTDAKRLRQIIRNLVANAIKFTAEGSVRIQLTLSDSHLGTSPLHELRLEVTDTGIGIAPEKHHSIFKEFEQADARTDRLFGGTGLGLSISRQLAEGMGGMLDVRSSVGQGSTFTLILPVNTADQVEYSIPDPYSHETNVPDLLELAKEVGDTLATCPGEVMGPPDEDLGCDLDFRNRSILVLGSDMRRVFSLMAQLEDLGGKVEALQDSIQASQALEHKGRRGSDNWDLVVLDCPAGTVDASQFGPFLTKASTLGIPTYTRGTKSFPSGNPQTSLGLIPLPPGVDRGTPASPPAISNQLIPA